jgi:geranylgeranyl pyrophosphate synthase
MHELKTGKLIQASVLMAACGAPALSATRYEALSLVGADTGLAFQILDDVLDVEGDPELMGKAIGHDRSRAKPTYPAVAGLDAAKRRAAELHAAAAGRLAQLGLLPSPLSALLDWLLSRRY